METGDVQGWLENERVTDSGTVESRQWIALQRPVASADEAGALALGRRYLDDVARSTRGLVRPRRDGLDGSVALVLVGLVPLLRFGPPQTDVGPDLLACTFPIHGGLLAARRGGSLVVAQRTSSSPELELSVAGYFPRLGGSRRRRSLRRALYTAFQARAHMAVGRRFLERAARRGSA
jgi:hypothetical protein